MVSANFLAHTSPINPPDASPVLTVPQIWKCLQLKIRAGQRFVGGAIKSTDVIEETTTPDTHLPVVVREVVFGEASGGRRVRERCVSYEPMKVEFHQPDGSKVQNIVSQDEKGELYMTYTFEWLHPELDEEGLKGKLEGERKMARMAVESTIEVMRRLVRDGEVK